MLHQVYQLYLYMLQMNLDCEVIYMEFSNYINGVIMDDIISPRVGMDENAKKYRKFLVDISMMDAFEKEIRKNHLKGMKITFDDTTNYAKIIDSINKSNVDIIYLVGFNEFMLSDKALMFLIKYATTNDIPVYVFKVMDGWCGDFIKKIIFGGN